MLTLINTNRMRPPIAPLGLDYVGGALERAGIDFELIDLTWADEPAEIVAGHFRSARPELVGLSLRNVDDSFWPSACSFLPQLEAVVQTVRRYSDAPIVLGGVGFSIFAEAIVARSGVEYGIRGDGEAALVALVEALRGKRRFDQVDGLIWRDGDRLRCRPPAWPDTVSLATERNAVDNAAYFRLGGQIGLETKRGCPRRCLYCADPLAKGRRSRLRDPREVADEVARLAERGIDVLHLCDAEFNIPIDHARDVCRALIDRRLGERVRWYAYLAVVPFDAELARLMRQAGCVGINFTSDAAHPAMLAAYRQPHRAEDLARAVQWTRSAGMAVMLDLLLGGPGETPETLAESIRFFRRIEPDCVGAGLGVRVYPGTDVVPALGGPEAMQRDPGIRRRYAGPIDLVQPTFYISPALGERPAALVRELIGGDPRFFEPLDEETSAGDHNYNDNQPLASAIAAGARGAYWDILRRL